MHSTFSPKTLQCGLSSVTFPIIAEAHLGLSKTNRIFPLTDAIKFLKRGLINTLQQSGQLSGAWNKCDCKLTTSTYLAWEIHLNGFDTNVLRSICHLERMTKSDIKELDSSVRQDVVLGPTEGVVLSHSEPSTRYAMFESGDNGCKG